MAEVHCKSLTARDIVEINSDGGAGGGGVCGSSNGGGGQGTAAC